MHNPLDKKQENIVVVPGAGFEPATSGQRAFGHRCSPDYESGALARLGYPGCIDFSVAVSGEWLTT
jgi:hypothetical protein